MEARISPTYVNLYMRWWEGLYIYNADNPHRDKIVSYFRYIDDLILITKCELSTEFLDYLNMIDLNLKFTIDEHLLETNFLDWTLSGSIQDKIVKTCSFRKNTSKNSLLNGTSCHAPHTIKTIPQGQFIWIRLNCSNITDYDKEAYLLEQRLCERAYCKSSRHQIRSLNKTNLPINDLLQDIRSSNQDFLYYNLML